MIPGIKNPVPTLANVSLLPRRRLRDGTIPQNGTSPNLSSSRGRPSGSSTSNQSSGSSRSSSRSSARGGSSTSTRRGVQRLRGGAVGGGRNKEDAVEVGDSDDGDDVQVIDVDAAEMASSFASPSKAKRARKQHRQAADADSKHASRSNNASALPSPPPSRGGPSAPIPDPFYLLPSFRQYAAEWSARHSGQQPRLWCLSALFSPGAKEAPSEGRYGMIILNQPITRDDVFRRAWTTSLLKICADGGANRLYDHLREEERTAYLPDLIKGDLDSIRPDVRSYYESKGVEVKQDPDEYSTDLMKCITEIEERETTLIAKANEQIPILLMGGLSGRVDQTVHTMSLLHKLRMRRSEVYVMNGESVAWVLDVGSHLINIDHNTMGQTCGILPVGVDRAIVNTEGLKWDLDGETSMDGLLSTSNHLLPENPTVYLKTSRPVMWCIEIKERLGEKASEA